MNKKRMLTGGTALALVACISVGGTLAYLSDKSDSAVNKFQMASGIEIQLWETADAVSPVNGIYMYKQTITNSGKAADTAAIEGSSDGNEKYKGTNSGITYSDILPGAQISKEPRLTVTEGTSSWVYLKVSNANPDLSYAATSAWEKVAENQDGTSAIYRYSTAVPVDGWTETPLFETVSVASTTTELSTFQNISMEGYAVQSGNVTKETADEIILKDIAFAQGFMKVDAAQGQ